MPIIFLTSKDQEQDEIIGLRMGACRLYYRNHFLRKLLNERIKTVLRIYSNRTTDEKKFNMQDNDQPIKKRKLRTKSF